MQQICEAEELRGISHTLSVSQSFRKDFMSSYVTEACGLATGWSSLEGQDVELTEDVMIFFIGLLAQLSQSRKCFFLSDLHER